MSMFHDISCGTKDEAADSAESSARREPCMLNGHNSEVPASRDTPANISLDSDSERPTKVVSRKQRIYTHFPKDQTCKVCKRTKKTRAPCRRRTGDAVLR